MFSRWPPALRGVAPFFVALPILGVAQLLTSSSPFFVILSLTVGVNVILAVSLNIVNGMTGQFSIGHAGFMAVGAYIGGLCSKAVGPYGLPFFPDTINNQLTLGLSLLVGGAAAALFGFLVGLPSLRLKGDYLAIVTLGFGEIIRVIIQNSESLANTLEQTPLALLAPHAREVGGALGMRGTPQWTTLFSCWLMVFVVVLVARRLQSSPHGRSLLAIREDEVAAEAMGVNTTAYKVRAFVVAAFFAGVAGATFSHYQSIVSPASFTYVKSMEIVVMVVAGGLGSTTGAILAAVVLTLLPEALRSLFLEITGDGSMAQKVEQIRMPIYGALLVVLMIVRPQGLFGTKEIWEVGPFKKRMAPPASAVKGGGL